ncbi:tetratricopeptide repeat protein [Rickettsia endosymbiont of Ceutorhynchus obstrictus]
MEIYDRLIVLYPNENESYLCKASILSMWGEKYEAIEIYKKLIKLNPDSAKAYERIGDILNDDFLEEYEEAINFYDKAIALEPKNAELYWRKADALNGLDGKQEELIKVVDKAIELDKKQQHLDGDLLFEIGKYDLAVKAFNNSITKYPSAAHSYYKISEVLFEIRKYNEALEHINKAIELKPNEYWYFYACQAKSLKELNRFEEALVACDKAIELGGAYSYHQKAVILDEIGEYSEAIICLNKGIMQYSLYDLEIYIQLKVKILCKLTKYDEALETLRNNKDFDTPYSEILTEDLIYILEKAERYEELLAEYDRLIMNDPGNAKLYDRKGMVFEKLGRLDEAAECYNNMIDVKRRNKEF